MWQLHFAAALVLAATANCCPTRLLALFDCGDSWLLSRNEMDYYCFFLNEILVLLDVN